MAGAKMNSERLESFLARATSSGVRPSKTARTEARSAFSSTDPGTGGGARQETPSKRFVSKYVGEAKTEKENARNKANANFPGGRVLVEGCNTRYLYSGALVFASIYGPRRATRRTTSGS